MSRSSSKNPAPSPGGKPIDRSDLENRLRSLKGDVDSVKESTIGAGVAAVGALALLLVVLAFVIGRSRGKQKFSFVEVRRG
jgi:hypothetical protein